MPKIHVMAEHEQPRHETVLVLYVPVRELEAMFPGGVAGYLERCSADLIPEFNACAKLGRDDLLDAIEVLTDLGFEFNQHMILDETELVLPGRRTAYQQEKGAETPWAELWIGIHPVHWLWLMVKAEPITEKESEDSDDDTTTDPGTRE